MTRHALRIALPLVLLAGPSTAQSPQVVAVQLSNFDFTPRTIVLESGRPYLLRLHNVAGGGHNFVSRPFFAAASVAPGDRRWVQDGGVEVPSGQVRDIRLAAPAAGRYKLKCTHRFHKTLGMSGSIIVR
ncbi:MAG TPA: cupredoxin domain-containing protein [Sphingomicrobium sp.]|nr:cupredoxin domain-containing protein [Sphingomicrobium sp.]